MAKDELNDRYLSSIKALLNIFEKLDILAESKQKSILEQKWDELYSITEEQKEVNNYFDSTMKFFRIEESGMASSNSEIKKIKDQIKKRIMSYKEKENTNLKLLKDSFFFAKQKVEKIFNKKINCNDTYNKDLKMVKDLWDNSPIIFDRLI